MGSFAKIKLSQKFPNLQYMDEGTEVGTVQA